MPGFRFGNLLFNPWNLRWRSGGCLFDGNAQYDRFRKQLGRILEDEEVSAELARHGLKPDDLGSHSLRKGGATFVTSGSTAGR